MLKLIKFALILPEKRKNIVQYAQSLIFKQNLYYEFG